MFEFGKYGFYIWMSYGLSATVILTLIFAALSGPKT